ncbi:hypothetical protein BCR43DRAFT_485805 [Syncephalastrum racemosum]|uniref:MYND-type domain-containing protein n=1 Tax=Syncephalastrum racemosum TaxID=13706 RepID=A0A1X2HN74_SYNRA|nr:hypothetical protein BCR43DRAFT_485805 [Syncephalastrum racemosum]
MREPNTSSTLTNKPVLCITSGVYDRRALDCTATLPLINSLTHLAYMTSTSPRVRETLANDGGLEKLVSLVLDGDPPTEYRHFWKWSVAFQCIANTGIRGSERVRTRIVEAGALQAMIPVLESYLHMMDTMRHQQRQIDAQQSRNGQARNTSLSPAVWPPRYPQTLRETRVPTNGPSQHQHHEDNHHHHHHHRDNDNDNESYLSASLAPRMQQYRSYSSPPSPTSSYVNRPDKYQRRSTFPYIRISPGRRRTMRKARAATGASPFDLLLNHDATPVNNPLELYLFYRKEDVVLCLQLLAFLSKYNHIREVLHKAYEPSLFALVEKFCGRTNSNSIKHWAGIAMRNACRRDEARGGLRRCAHWRCHKWEQNQREFAKCKRCRKAKYCSKACQSGAWSEGHRWWCVERRTSSTDHGEEQAEQQQDHLASNVSDRPHTLDRDASSQPTEPILPSSPALAGQSMIRTDDDRHHTISF